MRIILYVLQYIPIQIPFPYCHNYMSHDSHMWSDCRFAPVCVISTSNSMGSSEIWDKYHECCIGNGDKFHEAKPSEIYHFQYNKSGIYPKFHCYPCYSQLIPYSLHMRMPYISVAMYAICHYVLNMCQHLLLT